MVGPPAGQVAFGPDPAAHVQGILRPVHTHSDKETAAEAALPKLPEETQRAEERRTRQVVSVCPPVRPGPSAADCHQTAGEDRFWRRVTTPLCRTPTC